jgi:hypothetical protein
VYLPGKSDRDVVEKLAGDSGMGSALHQCPPKEVPVILSQPETSYFSVK